MMMMMMMITHRTPGQVKQGGDQIVVVAAVVVVGGGGGGDGVAVSRASAGRGGGGCCCLWLLRGGWGLLSRVWGSQAAGGPLCCSEAWGLRPPGFVLLGGVRLHRYEQNLTFQQGKVGYQAGLTD